MFDYYEVINLGYPNNVLAMLGVHNPTEDQIKGYEHAFYTLSQRNQNYLSYRFSRSMTLQECANHFGVSRQCVDESIRISMKKLKSDKMWPYIEYGFHGYLALVEARKARELEIYQLTCRDRGRKRINRRLDKYNGHDLKIVLNRDIKSNGYYMKTKKVDKKFDTIYLFDFNPSVRVVNSFNRKGLNNPSISEVLHMIINDPKWFSHIRNLGKGSVYEIYDILFNQGCLTKTEYKYLKGLV